MGQLVVIDDYTTVPSPPSGQGLGLVARNFRINPYGSLPFAKPFNIPLLDRSEWMDRVNERVKNKEQLSDIRNTGMFGGIVPSRDQNGKGYCWAHSPVTAAMLMRAIANMPYVDLSAYSVACPIKDFRDEGGWNAESIEWIAVNGIADSKDWPQQSMNRSCWNEGTKAHMKLHIFTEWMDLDPNQMEEQFMTCLLLGIPVASDHNWWSHSICGMDFVDMDTTRIWNSWGDSWSENGTGLLKGRKRIPDNAIALRAIKATVTQPKKAA